MLRLDTFIVAEFVSMLNFFYEKCWDTGLVTPTFIIEPKNRELTLSETNRFLFFLVFFFRQLFELVLSHGLGFASGTQSLEVMEDVP